MSYSSTITGISNLQLYWRLGDTSGTTATDTSGNSNTGTYTNATGYSLNQTGGLIGDSNPSVLFTRANSGYVEGANALGSQTSARSMGGWINSSNYNVTFANNMGIMGDQNGNSGWFMYCYSFGILFGTYNSGVGFVNASSTGMPSVNAWHFVIGTWDGDKTFKIYRDGIIDTVFVNGTTVTPVASTLTFDAARSANGTNYFNGYIDEVVVYTKELSAAEVLQIYQASNRNLPRSGFNTNINGGISTRPAAFKPGANPYAR